MREKQWLPIVVPLLLVCCLIRPASAGTIIDKSREGYLLCIPKGTGQETYPLLVCLPGFGVPARQDINNWAFPADKKGFLVVDFDVAYHLIGSVQDVEELYGRIDRTIASLATAYPIDTQRVFIAGTSAGGMMSIALFLLHPERFRAAGIVCGAQLRYGARENLNQAAGRRFYMVHGKRDKRVPIGDFYATKKLLEKYGALVESTVLEEGEHTLPSGVYRDTVDWLSRN